MDISRAPIVEPEFRDADRNEDVYRVHRPYGSTEFRVPSGTEVRMQDARWSNRSSSADPRHTLPNISVEGDAIVIPFCDIVEMVVARAEPAELAKSLWQNDDVREQFIYCMEERYSSGNIGDKAATRRIS